MVQKPQRLEGEVSVTIDASRPDKRRRDVDNLQKELLDLLCSPRD